MLSWAAWCYCSNTCTQSSTCLCSREVPLLALCGSCPYLTDGQQAWRSQTPLPKELFLQTRLRPGLGSLCLTTILLGSSAEGALRSQLQSGSSPACPRQEPPSASSPGRSARVHPAPSSPSQLFHPPRLQLGPGSAGSVLAQKRGGVLQHGSVVSK